MPPKQTKRERREATKAARFETERKARKQRRARFAYGSIATAAMVGLIVALILASGSNKVDLAALNKDASAAGCSALITVADQGATHIQSPSTYNYNSNPPTSGSHYFVNGVAPGPTGVHPQPFQDEIQVHNLEHSQIGIQYSSALSSAMVDALTQFTNKYNTWVFMAPRPTLPTGVALAFTRWGGKVTCASPTDASAVVKLAQAFYDDFHAAGPESVPGTPITG